MLGNLTLKLANHYLKKPTQASSNEMLGLCSLFTTFTSSKRVNNSQARLCSLTQQTLDFSSTLREKARDSVQNTAEKFIRTHHKANSIKVLVSAELS